MGNEKLLVVEDEEMIRELIREYLEGMGFSVLEAENGRIGIDMFRENSPDLILLDLNMPEVGGLDVLAAVHKKSPETPVIVVSGGGILEDAIEALRLGAWDYITKPIADLAVLEFAVNKALERARFLQERKRYHEFIEEEVKRQTKEILNQKDRLEEEIAKQEKILNETVNALAATAEQKDPYTAGHQQGVARLACDIAMEMELPENQINGIRMAATLHDIGKIYVPSEFLAKPSKLNDLEMNIMKTHSRVGYDILKNIPFPWPVAQIVRQHHERLDGSGYPDNLTKEEILLEAKIIAVSDVVEAMSTHRPYRPSLGIDVALGEISRGRGTIYDTDVVDACLKLFIEKDYSLKSAGKW